MTNSVLSGVKIVDFSRILAAPFASMILGDLGAEIWKIEKPGSGDEVRNWIPPSINGQSCYYLCANRNKKSIALNLAHKEGQNLARRLSANADVLLENFKTGNMEKFGLDYDSLSKINKGLIYCSITGYGSTGPYASDPGYDVIAEAVGGFMGTTGPKSGDPCKAAVAVTDLMTGLYAHGAILAALLHRAQTDRGQKIDCNLLATQIAAMANLGSNYLNAGVEAKPWGTEHESIVPYQAFKTKDGRYYVIGCANNASFAELCKLMELDRLDLMPEFQTNKDRVKNRKRLLKIIQDRFYEHDLDHWTAALRTSHFPSGPVNTLKEAFAHPQVQHLGLVQTVEHETYGKIRLTGPPVEYSNLGNKIRTAPPLLGEHTKEVLKRELDLSENQLADLKSKNVIDY